MTWLGWVSMAVLVGALSGCATISGTLPEVANQVGDGILRVGAARADITPPPGFPMGGHSVAGQVSRGHWLRLYARAVYLQAPGGQRIVLVSTDLWSVSAGFADRVAEIVGASECPIARDRLVVAATHTHQSPGNFSSSSLYNALASSEIGFDNDLFEYVAARTAHAVLEACKRSEPAIARYAFTRVPYLARNRSLPAFLQNGKDAEEVVRSNSELPASCLSEPTDDPRSCRAVDARVQSLLFASEIDPNRTIAIAAFVPVHATAVNHHLPVYSGDLFGLAAIRAERLLVVNGNPPPVVALFNGAEGDISPAWKRQNRDDLLQLGEQLGRSVAALVAEKGSEFEVQLAHRFALLPIASTCLTAAANVPRTCTLPHVRGGPAALGGAEDGRTFLYKLGCEEGVGATVAGLRRPSSFLCSIAYAIAGIGVRLLDAPESLPLGVYKVGPVTLATLPGEFTTIAGLRVRDAVAGAISSSSSNVILVGLANEYVSYFTTPEEFAAQQYEGASTLYGPASTPVVIEQLRTLAASLQSRSPARPKAVPSTYSYAAGLARNFSPADLASWSPEQLENSLRESLFAVGTLMPMRRFCWVGPARQIRQLDLAGLTSIVPHARLQVEVAEGNWRTAVMDGGVEDDDSGAFITALASWSGDSSSWCTFWLEHRLRPKHRYRLAVQGQDGEVRFSSPWRAEE